MIPANDIATTNTLIAATFNVFTRLSLRLLLPGVIRNRRCHTWKRDIHFAAANWVHSSARRHHQTSLACAAAVTVWICTGGELLRAISEPHVSEAITKAVPANPTIGASAAPAIPITRGR
jgi:hypothetical protein